MLYVCKANNMVRDGKGFKKVPCNCNEIKKRSSYQQKNKKTKIRKARKRVQKTKTENRKTETKLKAMKTTNNVQKTENMKIETTKMKSFAVVIGLVLISISVSAGGFFKTQFIGQENERLLAYTTASEINLASNAFFLETSAEKKLELESWMTDVNYFSARMTDLAVETEEFLRVEDWMLTNQNFSGTTIVNESDSDLQVEAWMLDELIWNK